MTAGLGSGPKADTIKEKQEPRPQKAVPARTTSNGRSHCSTLRCHDNRKLQRVQGDNTGNIRRSHSQSSAVQVALQLWARWLPGSSRVLQPSPENPAGHDCSSHSPSQMQGVWPDTRYSPGNRSSVFTDSGRSATVDAALSAGQSRNGIAHAGKQ